jgi:hypothetical protein
MIEIEERGKSSSHYLTHPSLTLSPPRTAGLTCFDISTFTPRLSSVDDFIRSLRSVLDENSDRHLKFEEVLRYADFPSLDLPPWDTNVEKTHREIFDALMWLRKKKVRKIMALKVLDRMYRPHDEKAIAIRTRVFEVEKLDWRYLDMAISYLSDPDLHNSPERLTELHLYSSGKRAAVDHWIGPNGVRVLKKVCVYLTTDIPRRHLTNRPHSSRDSMFI